MKFLERYLLIEFFKMLFGALLFFSMVVMLSEFLSYLNEYMNRPEQMHLALLYHILRIPNTVYYVFPLTVMFASTYVLGTFVKNNEMISLYNAGVSTLRFIAWLMGVVLIMGVLLIAFWEWSVAPNLQNAEILKKRMRNYQVQTDFHHNVSIYGRDGYLYIADKYDINKQILYGLMLMRFDENDNLRLRIDAKRVYWHKQEGRWYFENGSYTEFEGDNEVSLIRSFKLTNHDLHEKPHHFDKETVKLEDMSLKENYRFYRKMKDIHGNVNSAKTELFHKLSVALVSFILVILSASFSRFSSQSVLVISFAIVIVFAMLFYIFMYVGRSLGASGVLPPMLGAWLGNIVFLILAVVLFKRYGT